jgi:hypothetical protein
VIRTPGAAVSIFGSIEALLVLVLNGFGSIYRLAAKIRTSSTSNRLGSTSAPPFRNTLRLILPSSDALGLSTKLWPKW